MLNHTLILLLARILPLFVYYNANSIPGNTVDFQICCGDICGAFLFENAHSLDIYNISFLVDSHVCGQMSNSIFSEGLGFPRCLSGKEFACQCRRCGFHLWIGKILLEKMTIHSSTLAGKSHGQRSLVGYSPWGHKETRLSSWAHREHAAGASPPSLCFGHFGESLEDGGSSWKARTVCFPVSESSGSFPTHNQNWVISHALAWLYKAGVAMVTISWQSGEVKWSEALVAPSCPTLCDLTDWSPPGSSICGILQVRILEWAVISFSRGNLPDPEFKPRSPAIQTDSLLSEATGKPQNSWVKFEAYKFSPWLLIL